VIDSGAVYKNYGLAQRTITCASVIATDAVTVVATVNGVTTTKTFACVASGATGDQFNIGGTDALTATALAAKIDAMDGITAAAVGAVITVNGTSVTDLLTITTSDTTFTLATNGINTTLLGATRGGNTFTIETEYKDLPVDGAHGMTKGGRRITNVSAKLVANVVEFSTDLLKLAMPGSSSADYPTVSPTHDQITRGLSLALTDYCANIVVVGQVSGSTNPVICGVQNVIADGNLEISFQDKEESVAALTFTAHFDPSTLDTEPWFIRYPKS
jgi:hypothetical protein